MRFIFALVSLICLALVYKSSAAPVDAELKPMKLARNVQSRDFIHCLAQCLQPVGEESEDADIPEARFLGNYANLFGCAQQCSKRS